MSAKNVSPSGADPADRPTLTFRSAALFEKWVAKQPAGSRGLWLQIAKKGSGVPSVTHPAALDVALCHGWIDGVRHPLDDVHYLQLFTPRTANSRWSARNRDRALELIEEGRMRQGGLDAIEAAKADGRWDAAYASPSQVTVPEDLQRELDKRKNAKARKFFDTLKGQNRYSILYRIEEAKRPETRARRIAEFVAMLNEGRTIYPR